MKKRFWQSICSRYFLTIRNALLKFLAIACYLPFGVAEASDDLWEKSTYLHYANANKIVQTSSLISRSKMIQLTFRPNGFNNLPNPRALAIANSCDPANATFRDYNVANTEWFGVMLINAVNNGDNVVNIATGGNHGSSGRADGKKTAKNLIQDVYVDGEKLDSDYDGYANYVLIKIVNELMASNTISLDRYVLKQEYWVRIVENTVSVHAKYTALEDLIIKRDRALQLNTQGYRDSVLFVGGSAKRREVWNPAIVNSGSKSIAPHAWAAVLNGEYGQIGVWMDRSFGTAADLSTVADDKALIHTLGRATTQKLYNAIVFGKERQLKAGHSYEWRGGYTWSAQDTHRFGVDSILKKLIDQDLEEAIIYPDGNFKIKR